MTHARSPSPAARPRLRVIRGGRSEDSRPAEPRPSCSLCGWPVQPGDGIDVGPGPTHFVCRARDRGEELDAAEIHRTAAHLLGSLACIPSVRRAVELAVAETQDLPSPVCLIDLLAHAVEAAPDLDEPRRRLAHQLIRAWRAGLAGGTAP